MNKTTPLLLAALLFSCAEENDNSYENYEEIEMRAYNLDYCDNEEIEFFETNIDDFSYEEIIDETRIAEDSDCYFIKENDLKTRGCFHLKIGHYCPSYCYDTYIEICCIPSNHSVACFWAIKAVPAGSAD